MKIKDTLYSGRGVGLGPFAILAVLLASASANDVAETSPALVDPSKSIVVAEDVPYEAGRGLLTLEGPTGMFLNPTSATLPEHAFTLQYCFWDDLVDAATFTHGALFGYGVTDWLEVGLTALFKNIPSDPFAIGPYTRVRLLKRDGWIPQASVGYYGRFGANALEQNGLFGALYQRIDLGDGLVKSAGFHAGVRGNWYSAAQDQFHTYGGIEIQLPYRVYVVGEISTKDNDVNTEVPFAYGLQWRAGGVNVSAAMVQTGNFKSGPGVFFGVGSQVSF